MRPPAPARTLRVLATVLILVAPLPTAIPAHADTTTIDLTTSDPIVGSGEAVSLNAAVGGDASCLAGRALTLEWRPADSAGFATVSSGTSGPDGSASFTQSQPHTGRYRVRVSASGSCPLATSAEVLVRVRAFVDASVVTGSGEAGTCVDVFASVQPPRPGQVVDLQRRQAGAWTTIEQLTLDADSQVSAAPCYGFEDIGVVRIRVRWVAQDPLNETASSPRLAFEIVPAAWMDAIDGTIGSRSVSVAVGEDGITLFRHDDSQPRVPASNEKLLLAMAMLDVVEPTRRIRTSAAATSIDDAGVVADLWILGRGDPKVGKGTLAALARKLADAGATRVRGRVFGSTGYFKRDWDAPGWNSVARDYVHRPTALTFEGNHVSDPERRAAEVLTNKLEALGIRVKGRPGSGAPPSDLDVVASVSSKPLKVLLRKMLRPSDNFAAEVLGKRLAVEVSGTPGTIAKGAAAIEAFTDAHGTDFTLYDSSGLSYANRVSADGIVRLLWTAEGRPWLSALRKALPTGGQGTLRNRLHGVPVRAKTGSLSEVSALSGWVFASGTSTWVEFSILSSGMPKSRASAIEDGIVEILASQLT